jgi:hypothetical protein
MDRFDWKTLIPWLLSIATIAIGIWQYADKQAQANREPFLKEQLRLVFEASETVSTLANSTDEKIWQEARTKFWTLYWGPLGIVEDRDVASAMVEAGRLVPGTDKPGAPPLPLAALRQPSLKLSHAARDLILESWGVDLPPLEGQK